MVSNKIRAVLNKVLHNCDMAVFLVRKDDYYIKVNVT